MFVAGVVKLPAATICPPNTVTAFTVPFVPEPIAFHDCAFKFAQEKIRVHKAESMTKLRICCFIIPPFMLYEYMIQTYNN
jgi:hypothetical protein